MPAGGGAAVAAIARVLSPSLVPSGAVALGTRRPPARLQAGSEREGPAGGGGPGQWERGPGCRGSASRAVGGGPGAVSLGRSGPGRLSGRVDPAAGCKSQ